MSGFLHKVTDTFKPLPSHKGDNHDHHDTRDDRNERQAYSVSGAHGSTGLETDEERRRSSLFGGLGHHKHDHDAAAPVPIKTLASEEKRIYGYSTGRGAKNDAAAQDLAGTGLASQETAITHGDAGVGHGTAPVGTGATAVGTTASRYDDPATSPSYDRATTGDQTHSSGLTGGSALGAAGLGAAGATTSTAGQHSSDHDNDSYGTTSTGRARDETTGYAAGSGTEPSYETTGTQDTSGGGTATGTSNLPLRTRDEHGTPIIGSSQQQGYGSGGSDPRFSSANTYHDAASSANNTPNTTGTSTTAPHSSSLLNKLDPRVDSGAGATSSSPQVPGAYPSSSSTTDTSTKRNYFHCMHCGHRNDASQLQSPDGGAYTNQSGFLHCASCGHRNGVSDLVS